MIYLLTVKEILILSNNIHLFTKSVIIRGNYILTRNYIHFKEPYQFVQGIYPRSTKYIHSGKLYPFKEIYLQFNPGNSNCQGKLKLLRVIGVSSCRGFQQNDQPETLD